MKHYQIRQSITDRSSISVNLYLKDIASYPLLTEEEEVNLLTQYKAGDKSAKEKLIKSNLRFVISIAKQYLGRGVELSDLISCGNLGLIKAVDEYKLDVGIRFVSYAVWWIRNFILQEVSKTNALIRIPAGKVNLINKVNKEINLFEVKYGRTPTEYELSEILNMQPEDVLNILSDNINIVDNVIQNSDGEEESIFDTIASIDYADMAIQQSSNLEELLNILQRSLNTVEYNIIIDLFGLKGQQLTVDLVSKKYQITKERVRQIKDKAIIKLRKIDNINILMKFL